MDRFPGGQRLDFTVGIPGEPGFAAFGEAQQPAETLVEGLDAVVQHPRRVVIAFGDGAQVFELVDHQRPVGLIVEARRFAFQSERVAIGQKLADFQPGVEERPVAGIVAEIKKVVGVRIIFLDEFADFLVMRGDFFGPPVQPAVIDRAGLSFAEFIAILFGRRQLQAGVGPEELAAVFAGAEIVAEELDFIDHDAVGVFALRKQFFQRLIKGLHVVGVIDAAVAGAVMVFDGFAGVELDRLP
ncbi:hypothetical protein SDC9_92094 [bioreactor metagenome]|uniref:Uncharacterized protein n=1 Tax=bioreactor metagenome TaxID=1076179 RepID=A0A644ZXD0_9ZZZZ